MCRVNSFMSRTFINSIADFSGHFRNFLTCFLYRFISAKFRRTNNMETYKRFLIAFIGRVLWFLRRRSIFFIFFSPTDVYSNIACEAYQVCFSRRNVLIAIFFCEGGVRRVPTFFAFYPRTILNATRRDCFADFRYFSMYFFVRGPWRRCFINTIILCSNKSRPIRFFRVRVRFSVFCYCVVNIM